MIITTDPERYVSTSDWIENVGNPLLTFIEPTSDGDNMERRVLFEGMLDVDFAIIPKEKAQQLLQGRLSTEFEAQISNVFGRGMQIVLDKDGMAAQLQKIISSIENLPPRPPTQHEFLEVVNNFIYHTVFTVKHLRRGELWWTVTCLNCHMQRLLLQMMEWHALATHDWNYDTWFRGRFMEEWAHPQALKELRSTFAHYDEEDIKDALLALIELFHWIAVETAEKLSYQYPTKADKHVTRWIKTCF